jgi:hypothetical protein
MKHTILKTLADGEWHPASEFAHPILGTLAVEAWIAVLRTEGHVIDQRSAGIDAAYRLAGGSAASADATMPAGVVAA